MYLVQKDVPIIYLPSHRSHLDYILLTFIIYHWNIKAPHVAAGDNLNISFFGYVTSNRLNMHHWLSGRETWLCYACSAAVFKIMYLSVSLLSVFYGRSVLKSLGGFFIRRTLDKSGKKDLVYRAVLQTVSVVC